MRRKRQAARRCNRDEGRRTRRRLGATRWRCPRSLREAWRIHPMVQEFEAHQALAWEYREHYDAMAPLLRGQTRRKQGRRRLPPMTRRMGIAGPRAGMHSPKLFEDVDVLLTLSAPGAAPKGLGSTGDARYNRLWTLMGVPCVNVPDARHGRRVAGRRDRHRAIRRRCSKALAAARFVEKKAVERSDHARDGVRLGLRAPSGLRGRRCFTPRSALRCRTASA